MEERSSGGDSADEQLQRDEAMAEEEEKVEDPDYEDRADKAEGGEPAARAKSGRRGGGGEAGDADGKPEARRSPSPPGEDEAEEAANVTAEEQGETEEQLQPAPPAAWGPFPLAPELVGAPVDNGGYDPAPQAWAAYGGPPPKGLLGYVRQYECVCGRVVTANHIGQCAVGQMNWALNQTIRRGYEKAVAKLKESVKLPDGWAWAQEDVPAYEMPLLLHPLQYQQMARYFPRVSGQSAGPAGAAARAFVAAEETRFWTGQPTHRAMAAYVSRVGGPWPGDALLDGPEVQVPVEYEGRVPALGPGWVPRDLVVAQALKNVTYRNGGAFNLLAPNLLKAAGSNRGMMVLREEEGARVGRAGKELVKYAIRADRKAPDGPRWLPDAMWAGPHRGDLEAYAQEVDREDRQAEALLKRPPVGRQSRTQGGAVVAAGAPPAGEGEGVIEIQSEEEEELQLPRRSAKKPRRAK